MKALKSLIALVVAVFTLSSCAGGSEKQTETTGSESSQEQKTDLKLDIERIYTYKDKDASEITASDYDFILDQYEIMIKQAEGMTNDEYSKYLSQLSEEEQGAVLLIGLAVMAADNSGKFSESQAARFKELESKAPKQ